MANFSEVAGVGSDEVISGDVVDEVCEEIARAYLEAGANAMMDMCGNEGQSTIIDNGIDDYLDLVDDVSQGEVGEWEPEHSEAVIVIGFVGYQYAAEGAFICGMIRAIVAAIEAAGGVG